MSEQAFQEFVDVIAQLRSENGCPWDREQTHDSLRPCIMEEAAELSAAIRVYNKTGDYANLREELGDVLLQVVMQSQIAKEEGLFTIEDVIKEVSEKMVRRHPHVFGNVEADTSSQVLKNWEEIKKQEKAGQKEEVLKISDIPLELPALARAQKASKKVKKATGNGLEQDVAYKRLKELVEGLEGLGGQADEVKKEHFGELLFVVSELAREMDVKAEQALYDKVENYLDIFRKIP